MPLKAKLKPDRENSDGQVECFKAGYLSLGRKRVYARYCRPRAAGKHPAVLISPWYAQDKVYAPADPARHGVAALWFQGRGFEVDLSSYPQANSWYVLDGIESPSTYVYREIVAHALRGVDFLAARPEVDARRIGAMGASQGGGLSLLLAELDPRVSVVAADFPFLSDWPDSLSAPDPPYADVRRFIEANPDKARAIRDTVSYFDALSAANRISVPALVQVGLKDRTCPPDGIKTVYARIASSDKSLKEWPSSGHGDDNSERWAAMQTWMYEKLNAP